MTAQKKPGTTGAKKNTRSKKKQSPLGEMPQLPQGNFWVQMAITLVVFVLLLSAYSSFSGLFAEKEEVSLSQLAADINSGLVTEVEVSGENLKATYPAVPVEGEEPTEGEEVVKESKKESEASLTETLVNYGVTHEALSAVNITIADPSGFRFWFMTLAPLLIPVIVILLIIWYLSRQVRGSGMQAFTFGQSKALSLIHI